MRTSLLLVVSVLVLNLARAQEPGSGVSTSRSGRVKISTKPIFEASLTGSGSNGGASNPLQSIQFVQSKAEFLPGAEPALDQLVAFMRDKPTVEIELTGHTDNQGDFDENVRLSKKRVDLVKDYLVKNGIAAKRISTRGYGPIRPIASNKSEATRQLNRRVEMTVTKQ
ncbi:OmpA family protein [Spirosoma soli]|uniref:OmpA family protein n=1 Tax=Spirosoma soli TaxID=1770529 RepID=A0ABW5M3B9_9BACT